MPFARLLSAAFIGLEALPIVIEVDIENKLGNIRLVGLPDAAVKESKDRVLHAIKNSGFSTDSFSGTIHLAPADIKKIGAFYDLPIALGVLHSLGVLPNRAFDEYLIGGELGLTGEIRPIVGALSLSILAKKLGKKGVLLPRSNAAEASLVPGQRVVPLQTLKEAINFFKEGTTPAYTAPTLEIKTQKGDVNMSEIKGQAHAKRALEIAATGGHNFLMYGPPGTGKSLLAKAFIGLLPPLSFEEALEVANIHSLAGVGTELILRRPFRAPHHTISFAGMVGGGTHPKPGEISLAHKGVLFLDELPEFSRSTLEVLRQPLEDRKVTLSRAGGKATFPTEIICIGAMNPCPCGHLNNPNKPCTDTPMQVNRYLSRISGPFLDRMDLHLEIPPLLFHELTSARQEEPSESIRQRVQTAQERLKQMPPKYTLDAACTNLMKEAVQTMGISARGYSRILKVAQTIACLDQTTTVAEHHLLEALSYHSPMRSYK